MAEAIPTTTEMSIQQQFQEFVSDALDAITTKQPAIKINPNGLVANGDILPKATKSKAAPNGLSKQRVSKQTTQRNPKKANQNKRLAQVQPQLLKRKKYKLKRMHKESSGVCPIDDERKEICCIAKPTSHSQMQIPYALVTSIPSASSHSESNQRDETVYRERMIRPDGEDQSESDQIMSDESTVYFEEYFYLESSPKSSSPCSPTFIECAECRTFVRTCFLVDHILRHHHWPEIFQPDYVHFCGYCMRIFITPEELETHRNLHHEQSTFCCMICLVQFKDDQSRMDHMRNHHFRHTMPYTCGECQYRSSLHEQVTSHFENNHDKPFCPICLHVFRVDLIQDEQSHRKLYDTIEEHLMRHTRAGNYFSCNRCALNFISLNDLTSHQEDHSAVSVSGNENIDLIPYKLPKIHQKNATCYKDQRRLEASFMGIEYSDNDGFFADHQEVMDHAESKLDEPITSHVEAMNESEVVQPSHQHNEEQSSSKPISAPTPIDCLSPETRSEDRIYFKKSALKKERLSVSKLSEFPHRLKCVECNVSLLTPTRGLSMHLEGDKELACLNDLCGFRTHCRLAQATHQVAEMNHIGTRARPFFLHSSIDHHHRLLLCQTCGHSSNDTQELASHIANNSHHREIELIHED